MYGGRATARMNTNLIVYVEQHFDTKDAAFAYLKSAGLIEIADGAMGIIRLSLTRMPSEACLSFETASERAGGTYFQAKICGALQD
jgi:hypothetical protein